MEKAIIVDLDGTLTNVDHRLHHIQKEPKDWNTFNHHVEGDALNIWCAQIITAMRNSGYKTVLLTGRREKYRDKTEAWLKKHDIQYEVLHMRKDHEDSFRRPDHQIKRDIYQKEIAPKYNVLFVLEDRLKVVRMWREIGVTCLQCDWGDF